MRTRNDFTVGQTLDPRNGFRYNGQLRTGIVREVHNWGIRMQILNSEDHHPEDEPKIFRSFSYGQMN